MQIVVFWIQISPMFTPKGPISNKPAPVYIMALRRTWDKPLSQPKMAKFIEAYMRHSACIILNIDISRGDIHFV